jgi:4-hydroxybenzoate polyprenyltransferase
MSFLHFFSTKFKIMIAAMEGYAITAVQWISIASVLILLRTILEGVSTHAVVLISAETIGVEFLYIWSFYIAVFSGVVLLLTCVTRERVERVGAFVLVVMTLILIPPFLDMIATHGKGSMMLFEVLPPMRGIGDVLRQLWNFILYSPYGVLFHGTNTNPIAQLQINYGIRIEVILEFFLFLGYVFVKTRNIFKTLLTLVGLYVGLFFIATLPSLVEWAAGSQRAGFPLYNLSHLNKTFGGENQILYLCFILMAALQMVALYFFYDRPKFYAVAKNIRFLRLIFNLLLMFIGLGFAIHEIPNFAPKFIDILIILAACGSVICYWAWTVSHNDLADERGDAVSMKNRPLPQGILTRIEMRQLSNVFLIASLLLAISVGYGFLLFILPCVGIGYIYSSEPFRLKRFPILSNIVIAVAYLSLALAGYMIFAGHTILSFSSRLAVTIFISFTFGTAFKDIKDYEGDAIDGIKTLPVLFGLQDGKKIIGAMGFLVYMVVAFMYIKSILLFIPPFMCAGWYYWIVTREQYEEREVFVAYFVFIAYMVILYAMHLI